MAEFSQFSVDEMTGILDRTGRHRFLVGEQGPLFVQFVPERSTHIDFDELRRRLAEAHLGLVDRIGFLEVRDGKIVVEAEDEVLNMVNAAERIGVVQIESMDLRDRPQVKIRMPRS